MLRIVLGRAGSGKTEHCLREARAALRRGGPLGPPLILLAPEQATHQLERALLEPEADGRACTRLEVLSFARLAHRVLQAVGGLGRARLGAAGLRMLLRQALREHAGSLRAFAAGADRPGLAAALARQIAELQAYALSPEALRAAAAAAPPGTASRLHDVALLWEAEREALRALGLGDPGSDLAAAAAGLTEAGLQSAEVWVDGFAGFTGGEEAVLLGLLRAGCHLTVTLCLDPDDAPGADGEDPGHPFAPTRRTLRRLLRAGTAEVVRLPARGAPPRFPAGGDLARLEAGLWDGPAAAPPGGDGAVRFLAADDPAAEAEGAAAEIDRLVRLEGFRYREVAVIVRDLAAYRAPLEAACRARGIPVFVDLRRPAEGHPGPRVLRAALEVLASGWRLPAMRRYLHCDLCPLRRDQADALENLALARGLSGSDWYAPGTDLAPPAPGAARPDRARLRRWANAARARAVRPLRALEAALAGGLPAEACWSFLEAVGAPAAAEAAVAEARAAGRTEEADWHAGCWEALVDLLEQMDLALPPAATTPAEALEAVEAGLRDRTVGLVPPRLDQVLCGAVERSRQPALRAAFVLGLAEGAFPAARREEPLLGDAERSALRAGGSEIGPTSEEHVLGERYLAYIALTRASERLYLSHARPAGPSEPFRRAQALLGAAPWPSCPRPTARRGLPALAAEVALGGGPPGARRWLEARHPDVAALLRRRSSAGPLAPDLAAALFAGPTSPSRLESFAACPFQHFARSGLRLQPREEAVVLPSHIGLLVHAALAELTRALLRDGLDVAELPQTELTARAEDALRAAADHVLARLPARAPRGPYLVAAAGRDVRRAACALAAHARAGAYRPAAAELGFEHAGVRGRIDRVDRAAGPRGPAVRVVDYKTGQEGFSLLRFLHGLDLAPALYLAAAAAAEGAEPGGAFTLGVRDRIQPVAGPEAAAPDLPRLKGLSPDEVGAAGLHETALDGAVTGVRWKRPAGGPPRPWATAPVVGPGGFPLLLRAAARRARHLRAAVAAGTIAPAPAQLERLACEACEFLAVCGFDRSAGDRARVLARPPDPWTLLLEEEQAAGGPTPGVGTEVDRGE